MIPPLHISLLGDFALVSGETPVTTLNIPRVQSLFAYLVLHRNAPQKRSHLAFLLWPDSAEAQAHTNLRQLLYHLRQALPNADSFLRADKQYLQWLPAHPDVTFTLDVQEVEQALVQAEQAEQAQDTRIVRQKLEQVLCLYRGDLLSGCYEEWILPERDRLRQLFYQASERFLTLAEQERDYGTAISVAQRLLRADPLDEAAYRHLMRLYALRGERAAAMRTYHVCAQLLERELGVEPSEMTQTLYASLRPSAKDSRTPMGLVPHQRTEAPLQGRRGEWQQMLRTWNYATSGEAGKPQIMILSGEAGIGKTRLAKELEGWVSRRGITTMSAGCYAALEHLAYAPVAAWLRSAPFQATLQNLDPTSLTEIARLVPEVLFPHPHLSPPAAMTEGWQRQFFLATLTRALLSTRQPLLLLIDDLHWCDQETLEWLHYLLHFTADARLLIVGTVRAEEILPEHPLTAFLEALQRDGLAREISLGPLTLGETASLAEHILERELDPGTRQALYQESEGNPFFVVEIAQAEVVGKGTGRHPASSSSLPLLTRGASSLPPTVQALLAARFAQLSARAREVANVAAIIGREFSFPVLAHACQISEEAVVQGLDELWQRRLVRERGAETANAYDFSHDKLREQLSASLSPAHRRHLHQRVAQALTAVYAEDLDVVCGQIAAHYEQAGIPSQAIAFYQRAGTAASRMYAHKEALHAFGKAVELLVLHQPGEGVPGVPWEVAAQVYTSLGDIFEEIGSQEEARQAYQRAQARIPSDAQIWQARVQWKIATTWTYSFARESDVSHISAQAFAEAERILTQGADPANSEWRDEWLALQFARVWRGSVDEMEEAIHKARPVVEQQGTPKQRKLFAEAVGIYNAIRSRFIIPAQRVAAWRATVAVPGPAEDEVQRGMDLALIGIGLLSAAQFDEAEEQLRLALRMGERTGNAWLQRNCLTFLPFALRSRGKVEETRRILALAESMKIALDNHILRGHHAWVAWREGNLALAETYGRESLQEEPSQQSRPNPFLWAGRWPLIGVALTQEQISTATDHVRLLFDSTQQPPREPLDTLLTDVLRTWDNGEQEQAHALLQQALPLAKQMGYL
ncbi:MAG: AAA family ATPase [Chloroflexi bacterium]|nr:AAA family ATPase [Chloroflexota bacterium]